MILTIQAPTASLLKMGVWEASEMMGLEVEVHADNTFDVIVFDKDKLDRIIQKTQGRVIAQRDKASLY